MLKAATCDMVVFILQQYRLMPLAAMVCSRAVPVTLHPESCICSKSGRNPALAKIPPEMDGFAGFGKMRKSNINISYKNPQRKSLKFALFTITDP